LRPGRYRRRADGLSPVDLAERYAKLLPREGDAVQDQRFSTAVNLVHSHKRTDDEIRKLAAGVRRQTARNGGA
jgi:hypothetical protein